MLRVGLRTGTEPLDHAERADRTDHHPRNTETRDVTDLVNTRFRGLGVICRIGSSGVSIRRIGSVRGVHRFDDGRAR
jgi:hypothetical protein